MGSSNDEHPALIFSRHSSEGWNPVLDLVGQKGNDKNWIPAFAGLRRQEAEANICAANGPKGELRTQRVMTS